MLKWLTDRIINAGQKDVVVVWDSEIQGHTENDGIKQLWYSGVCLTVCPPRISDVCSILFSILNTGPKAIAIGAQGTRLGITRIEGIEIINSKRLTLGETDESLPQNVVVDRQMNVSALAEFGPVPKFTNAVFVLQAKRILAPQISFQIPFHSI